MVIIKEFDRYKINVWSEYFSDEIEVKSGIGETISKTEWRDDHIANLFTPLNQKPKGIVLHLQGSAQLLQDGRSIALANDGFIVLELGYNLPHYGQPSIYFRSSFPLEYIKTAIDRLLQEAIAKEMGYSTLSILGHSKGGDLAISAACLFPELISLAIVNSCHLKGPVFVDSTYKNSRILNWGCQPAQLMNVSYKDEKGFKRIKTGMNEAIIVDGHPIFYQNQHGEYKMNFDACKKALLKSGGGFPLEKAKRIFAFQTVNDPVLAPTDQLGRDFGDFVFENHKNHQISYLESGHLCSIPNIPIVHSSFMGFSDYRFILDWSRNKLDHEQLKEANEIRKFYDNILFILNDHFQ